MSRLGVFRALAAISMVAGFVSSSRALDAQGGLVKRAGFTAATGSYTVGFQGKSGIITIRPKGVSAGLELREFGGVKASNLLNAVTSMRRRASSYTLQGRSSWASFKAQLTLVPTLPGLLHITLSLNPARDAPLGTGASPDIRLRGAPVSSLTEYAAATPVAGNAVYLGDSALRSRILYYVDYTALGPYFDRTKSGAAQPNFLYPGAGGKGSLVGLSSKAFGYEPPAGSIANLPHHKTTLVVDSYLYLLPGLPANETEQADSYLRMLGTIQTQIPQPNLPAADWTARAQAAAHDLTDPANLVSLNGQHYLRSYVSDTRTAPELITQAGVLAGLRAYESHAHITVPLDAILDQNLSTFYDPAYHTVVNHAGHDPQARDESWYYVDNLISLLQLTQLGDTTARQLLLDSVDGVIALAHANNYEFPVSFQYGQWAAPSSDRQPDVAGGYAWLMLGLHDLTGESRFLDEARASIAHVAGKGFGLAYELHMTAYTAAAAQRLYRLTGDSAYHGYAVLALANLFHTTRLWDCTYGLCRKGSGYHTYMGIDPLPTGDYIAMLEQYEAWLGLRDYARYDQGEPAYLTELVNAFLSATPKMMQYALPPMLPPGAATTTPGLYDFVRQNNLGWTIPLEDLREGELTSGSIGQEIYGSGGIFTFAAYG
jgi:hypothetical protein